MKPRPYVLLPGPLDDGLAAERARGCDLPARSSEFLGAEYRQVQSRLDQFILDGKDQPTGGGYTVQSYCRSRLAAIAAEIRSRRAAR